MKLMVVVLLSISVCGTFAASASSKKQTQKGSVIGKETAPWRLSEFNVQEDVQSSPRMLHSLDGTTDSKSRVAVVAPKRSRASKKRSSVRKSSSSNSSKHLKIKPLNDSSKFGSQETGLGSGRGRVPKNQMSSNLYLPSNKRIARRAGRPRTTSSNKQQKHSKSKSKESKKWSRNPMTLSAANMQNTQNSPQAGD